VVTPFSSEGSLRRPFRPHTSDPDRRFAGVHNDVRRDTDEYARIGDLDSARERKTPGTSGGHGTLRPTATAGGRLAASGHFRECEGADLPGIAGWGDYGRPTGESIRQQVAHCGTLRSRSIILGDRVLCATRAT
jgi:hypothetical protein